MIRYVVVTRSKPRIPIKHYITLASAANHIVREKKFAVWTVLAQEANRITAGTPYRELTSAEKLQLEQALWPTLFDNDTGAN